MASGTVWHLPLWVFAWVFFKSAASSKIGTFGNRDAKYSFLRSSISAMNFISTYGHERNLLILFDNKFQSIVRMQFCFGHDLFAMFYNRVKSKSSTPKNK